MCLAVVGWGGVRPLSATPNPHLSHLFPLQSFPLGPFEGGGRTPQPQPPPVQPRGPPSGFADQGQGAQSLTDSNGHPYLAAGASFAGGRGLSCLLALVLPWAGTREDGEEVRAIGQHAVGAHPDTETETLRLKGPCSGETQFICRPGKTHWAGYTCLPGDKGTQVHALGRVIASEMAKAGGRGSPPRFLSVPSLPHSSSS